MQPSDSDHESDYVIRPTPQGNRDVFITTQIIAGIMELILAGAIFGRADFFGFGCIALICGVPAALIAIPISLVTAPRSARGAGFAAAAFHVGFLMVMFLVGMNDPRPSMGSGAH